MVDMTPAQSLADARSQLEARQLEYKIKLRDDRRSELEGENRDLRAMVKQKQNELSALDWYLEITAAGKNAKSMVEMF